MSRFFVFCVDGDCQNTNTKLCSSSRRSNLLLAATTREHSHPTQHDIPHNMMERSWRGRQYNSMGPTPPPKADASNQYFRETKASERSFNLLARVSSMLFIISSIGRTGHLKRGNGEERMSTLSMLDRIELDHHCHVFVCR